MGGGDMRRHDEPWSVPLIAARAWSLDHTAGALSRGERPQRARLAALLTRLHLRTRLSVPWTQLPPAPPPRPRADHAG